MNSVDARPGLRVKMTERARKQFGGRKVITAGVVVMPRRGSNAVLTGKIFIQRDGLRQPDLWAASFWEPEA